MRSRSALVAAAAAALLLLGLSWLLGPGTSETGETRLSALRRRAAPEGLASRPLPKPRAGAPALDPPSQPDAGTVDAADSDAPQPARRRLTREQRELARERRRQRIAAGNLPPPPDPQADEPLDDDGFDFPRFGGERPKTGSIYDDLSDDELVEIVVGYQRLRDSGALRRLQPEDYPRILEIMPDSRGVQDAERIFQEILGMGAGEWLARTYPDGGAIGSD